MLLEDRFRTCQYKISHFSPCLGLSNPGAAGASLLPFAAAVVWYAARHAALLGLQCLAGIAREDCVLLWAWRVAGTLAPSVKDLAMIIIMFTTTVFLLS